MSDLTIGRVASAAGVNVETVRFYQRRKLLEEPTKPLGGVRRYPVEMVSRIRFIKRAQKLGFTLDEVQNLLSLEDGQNCKKTHDLAVKKLAVVEARITDLNRMRRMLKTLIAECETGSGRITCPIILTLAAPE
jgi:MerR family transcriptional regulator, mercuric resistance operon regulatory protein